MTIEVSGKVSKITAMQSLLEPYGILEVARSGRVALPRDSGVGSKPCPQIASATPLFDSRGLVKGLPTRKP